MRAPTLLPIALAAAVAAGAADTVPLTLGLEDQANALWSEMPTDPGDPRLARRGDADDACVRRALTGVRDLLVRDASSGRLALRELTLPLAVPKAVSDDVARGRASSGLLAAHVTAEARALPQAVGGPECGALYELGGSADEPGRLFLTMRVATGCGCAGEETPRVHLVGRVELVPGVVEKGGVLRLRAGPASYQLAAACDACASAAAVPAEPPAAASSAEPCDGVCGSLAGGLAAWARKAADAAGRASKLASRLTAVELQLDEDRGALRAAEAGRSRTRAVLARIGELQARIKDAEAELARVRLALRAVEEVASTFQRVADDAGAAAERCRTTCRAPRAPRPSSPGSPSAAAGGGIGTGALVAGGVVVAAGGAVALAAGGDGEAAPAGPEGPPDFSGTWQGTRVTTTAEAPGAAACRRVFDETWVIAQSGSTLSAAVTARAQGCGNVPPCGANCEIFSFPRQHPGSVDGRTARFFVFPELQVPSCVLPLALAGSTLRGTMPSCMTGGTGYLSDEVVLQRR
jgi:hypothetical protein